MALDVATRSDGRADHRGVIRLDKTLERLNAGNGLSGNPATTFARAVVEAVDGDGACGVDPLHDLFKRRSREQTRFVAGALLRLLAQQQEVFDDPQFGYRAQDLLDQALPDVYKELGLRPKQQTYEKQIELREVIPRAEALVKERASRLQAETGAAMRGQKDALLKSVKRARKLISLSLPHGLEDEVSALIDRAADVLDSPLEDRIAAERAFETTRQLFDSRVTSYGTQHADAFATWILAAIDRSVSDHRAAHPLCPASLTVRTAAKKYPLLEPERALRIRLVVQNDASCSAQDVHVEISATAGVHLLAETVYLGAFAPGYAEVEFDAISEPKDLAGDAAEVIGTLGWKNADGSSGTHEFHCHLQAQVASVDWQQAATRSPYSLTPLTDPAQLVGRDALLQTLEAGVAGDDSLSFLITGQKRVGKTSVVRVLATRLEDTKIAITSYVQVGTYADDPAGLARSIARTVRHALLRNGDSRAAQMLAEWLALNTQPKPSQLYDVIEDVLAVGFGASKLVLILDEFDELPTNLYRESDEARAFFNTLRSIMILPQVSVVLVGGERTNFVLAPHGQALNLLTRQRVDAFSRLDEARDFADLVRRPTERILEFTEQSISMLAEVTGGHPFYARMVCARLYDEMVQRRDTSVTPREIGEAVALTLDTASVTNFAHYWEDGILELEPERRQEVRHERVRLLVALARTLRKPGHAAIQEVETHARTLGLDPVQFQQQLTSFEQRRVIRHDRDSGRLTPVPPVFASWLAEHAVTELLTVIPDEAAHARAEQQRAEARVAASEIAELTRSWPPYRGRAIDGDQVRAWLEQFGDDVDQRRAYQVLRSLRFASDGVVRSAFREIHRSLMAGQNRTPATKAKFRDVLIVSPDPPGKSGPVYTRLYAQESSTHLSNITDLRQLHDRISTSGSSVRFVVVVDDFIGSGHSMADRLLELDDSTIEEMKQRDIQTSVVVYAATADGLAHLENALEGRGLDWAIRSHVTIGNDERVFSPAGSVFDSGAEREATKALFANVGTRLVPNAPLGYGDCELALTFEGNIPNNSLPPLWSRGPGWTPLFPRL